MFKKLAVLIFLLACASPAFADNSYWSAVAYTKSVSDGNIDVTRQYESTFTADGSGTTATVLTIPKSMVIAYIRVQFLSPTPNSLTVTVNDIDGNNVIPTSSAITSSGYTLLPGSGTLYPVAGGCQIVIAGNATAYAKGTVKVGGY